MIPFKYDIYGINTQEYKNADETVGIGTVTERFTYHTFNEAGTPLYSSDCSKVFDDSIYLWHISPASSVGTNSAFCISTGDTLDLQIVYNKAEVVPLAMQWCDIQNESFKRYPKGRMAYDYWSYAWFNYVQSKLFVDINRTKFCIRPVIQCYDFSTDTTSNQALSNVASWIDANPDKRIIFGVSFELFHGNETPRNMDASYIPDTSTLGRPSFDILTDRPIPDNATGAKTDMQYDFNATHPEDIHENWRTDKQYSPFTQAFTGLWYSGNTTVTSYNIGLNFSITVTKCRNGSQATSWGGKVTGKFLRYSDKTQDFNDVKYTWEIKVYYPASDVFLENGFPLNSLADTENIRVTSVLKILDNKGLSTGQAMAAAIKHEIAFLGFYFSDGLDPAQNATLGTANTHIFLPEIVSGETTGNYFTGNEIPLVPYANSTSCADFKYEPDDIYNDSTPSLNNSIVTAESVHMYAQVPITVLIENLNAIPSVDPDDQTLDINKFFFGADPYDFILGYYITPKFFIPQWYITEYRGRPNSIKLGKYECDNRYGAPAPICYAATLKTPLRRLFLKDVYIKRLFNNFLDYEPYSSLSLYLPFMGTVELPPSIFVGNTLSVYSSYDLISGMITYMIYAGDTQYVTKSAIARIDMPFHGRDISDYSRNMLSAYTERNVTMFNMISTLGSTLGRAGTAASISSNKLNPEGMVSSAVGGIASILGTVGSSLATANMYDTILMKSSPNPSTISMGSIADGFANTLTPYIIRTIPEYASGFKTEKYGKINGFSCYHNDTISNYHGFTVIENPILDDIPISQAEKELLRTLLHKGVILP